MIVREEKERVIWFLVNKFEDDYFEVVRDDFKLDVYKFYFLLGLGIKNNVFCFDSEDVLRNDSDCDLGDIDEIIVMKKNVRKVKNSIEFL